MDSTPFGSRKFPTHKYTLFTLDVLLIEYKEDREAVGDNC